MTHPSVCRLFAFSTDGPNRCLLLELCSGGALDTRLRCLAVSAGAAPPAPLQWRHRLRIALDIARALAHLHSQEPPILHRDMKVRSHARGSVVCDLRSALRLDSRYIPALAFAADCERVAGHGVRQRESRGLRHGTQGRLARQRRHARDDGAGCRHQVLHASGGKQQRAVGKRAQRLATVPECSPLSCCVATVRPERALQREDRRVR